MGVLYPPAASCTQLKVFRHATECNWVLSGKQRKKAGCLQHVAMDLKLGLPCWGWDDKLGTSRSSDQCFNNCTMLAEVLILWNVMLNSSSTKQCLQTLMTEKKPDFRLVAFQAWVMIWSLNVHTVGNPQAASLVVKIVNPKYQGRLPYIS